MVCKARRDASSSTGRVTSWNSVDRPNAAMPIVTSVLVLRIRPRISSGIAAIEPNCVSGMIAARSLIGA